MSCDHAVCEDWALRFWLPALFICRGRGACSSLSLLLGRCVVAYWPVIAEPHSGPRELDSMRTIQQIGQEVRRGRRDKRQNQVDQQDEWYFHFVTI